MLTYIKKYLKPYKKEFVLGPLFKLVEAGFELMLPWYMKRIIDEGIALQNQELIFSIGIRMGILIIINLLSAGICQYFASVASQGFGTKTRNGLFAHINHLAFSDLDQLGTNTLTTRMTNDINQLQIAVAMTIRLVSRAPFVSIGCIVMAMMMDMPLSVIIWAGVISFSIVLVLIMLTVFPMYAKVQSQLDGMSTVLRENLSGVRVIRAFDRVSSEFHRFVQAVNRHRDSVVRVTRIASLMNPATMLIMNLLICALLWFGGIRVDAGETTAGQIVALIEYIALILSALLVVANLVVIATKSYASLQRINEVFAIPTGNVEAGEEINCSEGYPEMSAHADLSDSGSIKSSDTIKPKMAALSFSDVSFSYTGNMEQKVLDRIHFSVEKGQTLGIIGGTGSGKSTILSLLLRFYDCQDGDIYIGETPIVQITPEKLRGRISCVFQNPRLFSGTIRDNLLWGKESASESELDQALNYAQAAEFVDKLADKMDARVERGGVNFSGGQKQRLSIGRALVKDAEILLLDDASSALDYATEANLRKAIRSLQKERGTTVLLVSQRIASVRSAEKILVLDEGRQVGLGTHDELMQECPEYRAIALSQFSEKEVS